MALCRKMYDGPRPVGSQQPVDQCAVADVALHENMAHIVPQRCEIFQITGISQFVEIDHRLAGLGQPVEHKIGANKSGPAGH